MVTVHRNDNFAYLLVHVEETHAELLTFVCTIPANDFVRDYSVHWKGYLVTIARLLRAEVKDEKAHLEQLGAFVGGRTQHPPRSVVQGV